MYTTSRFVRVLFSRVATHFNPVHLLDAMNFGIRENGQEPFSYFRGILVIVELFQRDIKDELHRDLL
ncbi:hypothetical protein BH24ACT2_BH24ACT2_06120 [soil metagenome]